MTSIRPWTWCVTLCALVCACGGEAKLGEECEAEGIEEGECEAGGVCGRPDDGAALECLKVCVDQADCTADQECNGVSGTSTKGCRPKDDTSKK